GVNAVVAQAPGILRIVPKDLEAPGGAVQAREPTGIRPDPEVVRPVLVDDPDGVVGQRAGVSDLVLEDPNGVTVPDGEALARAYPEEAGAIAVQRGDRVGRKATLRPEAIEDEIRGDSEHPLRRADGG